MESWPASQVFWLKYRNHPGSLFARHLDWDDVMVAPQTDMANGLQPISSNVFEHTSYSPPPKLASVLKHCRDVALVGMDTDACVQAAAFFLWDNGIRPLIGHRYCDSSGGAHCHKTALDLMRRQFSPMEIVDEIMPRTVAKLNHGQAYQPN